MLKAVLCPAKLQKGNPYLGTNSRALSLADRVETEVLNDSSEHVN